MATTAHPNFKLIKWTDFGTEEEWVARVAFGLAELLRQLHQTEEERFRSGEALQEMDNELSAAFMAVCNVRELDGREDIAFMELRKEYDAIYDHLARAYKDRMSTLAATLDYDIGFLFQKDQNFESGASLFLSAQPRIQSDFIDMLREDRRIWATGLQKFRNEVLQHRAEGAQTAPYFNVGFAEATFRNVWQAIEDTVVWLIEPLLPPIFGIYEIAPENRDPKCPRRYEVNASVTLLEALQNVERLGETGTEMI